MPSTTTAAAPLGIAADYLTWERSKPKHERSELFFLKNFDMAGAKWAHNIICSNLNYLLQMILRDKGFYVAQSDLRVNDPLGNYFYPDLVLIKGEPKMLEDSYLDTLTNPHLIVEVLSNSTERLDKEAKFKGYRHIESLQEYVLVSQDAAFVKSYFRNSQGDWLVGEYYELMTDLMAFKSVEAAISLQEIYKGVF